MDYQKEALRTLSENFYPERVGQEYLANKLNNFINAGEALDKIKRAFFYGTADSVMPVGDTPMVELSQDEQRILHAIVGIATEAAELIEALLLSGLTLSHLDVTNVIEETGDLEWYMAVLRDPLAVDQDEVQELNIEKLRRRYPDKFTQEAAENRDLVAERQALER